MTTFVIVGVFIDDDIHKQVYFQTGMSTNENNKRNIRLFNVPRSFFVENLLHYLRDNSPVNMTLIFNNGEQETGNFYIKNVWSDATTANLYFEDVAPIKEKIC